VTMTIVVTSLSDFDDSDEDGHYVPEESENSSSGE